MSSQTENLIPPETLAMVGQPLGAPVTAQITAKEAQRYAQAVGDLNPLYFDEAAAKAAGYRTLLAPPTFVAYAVVEGQSLDRLRGDGLFRGCPSVPLRTKRVMFGGEEWDFLAPACIGDVITAETRLKALEQKQGGSGPSHSLASRPNDL